jgi:hypothetical protein
MNWCSANHINYEINGPTFGLRLKRMNLKGLEKGRRTNKGQTTIFNIPVLIKELDIDNVIILKDGDLEEEEIIYKKKTTLNYSCDDN